MKMCRLHTNICQILGMSQYDLDHFDCDTAIAQLCLYVLLSTLRGWSNSNAVPAQCKHDIPLSKMLLKYKQQP